MGGGHTWTGNKLPHVRPLSCPRPSHSNSNSLQPMFKTPCGLTWAFWERNMLIYYIYYVIYWYTFDAKSQGLKLHVKKKNHNSCSQECYNSLIMMIKSKSSLHFTNHCCFVPFLPRMGKILFGGLLIIHVEFVLSLHRTLVLSFSSRCCNICHFTFQPAAFMWQVNIFVYPFRLFLTVNPAGISTSVRTSTGAYLGVCIVIHKPAVIFWYTANVWIFWVHPINCHSNRSVTNKLNALNSTFFSHEFDFNWLSP